MQEQLKKAEDKAKAESMLSFFTIFFSSSLSKISQSILKSREVNKSSLIILQTIGKLSGLHMLLTAALLLLCYQSYLVCVELP